MIRKETAGRFMVFLVVTIGSMISSSCFKMSYSTTGASIPVEAKTFSVQYIENQARIVEPGFSQQVTDGLKDYIQSNSNLTLVNGVGDIDFEAVITNYEPDRPVAIVSGDEAAMNRFTIGVKVKFTCNVKPELDFESSFSRYEDYSSQSNLESVKEELTKKMLDLIMEDIYKRAFVNW
jgi:hypothetical protein